MIAKNKDALRWCKNNRVRVEFYDGTGGEKVAVYMGKRFKEGDTLIQAVNQWVEENKKEKL